jgi:hypothetical protein
MIAPLQIEFHNSAPLEAVESRVRQELAELEKFYKRLVSCRVDVEAPEHERRGSICKVRIDFGLAPENAAARARLEGLEAKQDADHLEVRAHRKDAAMAVHAAFNVARRRLKESVMAASRHS